MSKGVLPPRIIGVITSIFTDDARLANHVHMLHSIRGQQDDLLDDLLISFCVNNDAVKLDTSVVYGGKNLVRDARHPTTIVKRKITQQDQDCLVKQYPSYFYQLKHLMEKLQSDSGGDWILFSTDDGIWHPKRVALFREAVQRVHADHSVTCVAFPSKRADSDKNPTSKLETATHVTEAIARKELRIYSWIPDERSEERFELLPQDLCVRASVVREFFTKTPDHLIQNGFCDVSFCARLMSGAVGGLGSRTHFQLADQWTYYARPAERRYVYLTFAQFIEEKFAFKNTFQMIPYVVRLAEMGDCPELADTAKKSLDDLFAQLATVPSEQAMLKREYTRAQKDKPWLLKRK
jgi:hypothetical protein